MTVVYVALALVVLLVALIGVVRRWGQAEAWKDSGARALSHARQSHEIEESVARLDDRTLDQRLRDAGH